MMKRGLVILGISVLLLGGFMATSKPVFDATTDKGALAWAQKSGGVPFSTKYLKKIGYPKTTK